MVMFLFTGSIRELYTSKLLACLLSLLRRLDLRIQSNSPGPRTGLTSQFHIAVITSDSRLRPAPRQLSARHRLSRVGIVHGECGLAPGIKVLYQVSKLEVRYDAKAPSFSGRLASEVYWIVL
jgi:hypothetical protein